MADHPFSPRSLLIGLGQIMAFIAVVCVCIGFAIGWVVYA